MNSQKLKRHPGLVPFAREHGLSLVCAQRLRKSMRATKHARIALVNYLKTCCFVHLNSSLHNEQFCFSPIIARTGLAHRFQNLHCRLRDLIHSFSQLDREQDPGIGRMSMIGNALEDYVRWEENYLFPALEKLLSNEELERLGKSFEATKQAHQLSPARPTSLYCCRTTRENEVSPDELLAVR